MQDIKLYSKITYFKNKEVIFTSGNSKAINSDGDIITADEFEYDKINNILITSGNVEIIDEVQDIKLYSKKITYFKKKK